jgi:hypothetical protein
MQRMYRLFLTLLLVLLILLPTVVMAQDSINLGDTIHGVLDEEQARIEYTFDGSDGMAVVITLISDDFDSYLLLANDEGEILIEDDDGAGQLSSMIEFTLPEDGEYTIVATSLREYLSDGENVDTGEFTLTLEGDGVSVPDAVVTETPPTVVPVTGDVGQYSIEFGETVSGQLSLTEPSAEYAFVASAGDIVTITLLSDDFDTYLFLSDDDGMELRFDDDGAGNLNSQINSYELQEDGTYIIGANSYAYAITDVTTPGSYTLSLELVDQPTGVIVTPTDVPRPDIVAGTISIGETIEGALSLGSPNAEYVFLASAGDVVTITLTSNDFDSYLLLIDANGVELQRDDDSAGGLNSQISAYLISEDGMYTIVADSWDHVNSGGVEAGSFTLMLASTATAGMPEGTQENIEIGDTLSGELSFSQVNRAYSFTASAGDIVTITLASDDFDSYLFLRDENGIEIQYDDDGAGNLNSRIGPYEVPEDGTYIIIADSFGNATGDTPSTGSYTLTLAAAIIAPIEYTQQVEGTISQDEPVMVYGFSGEEGDIITITFEGDVYSLVVSLRQTGGEFEQQPYLDEGGIIGPITLPESGNYNITVSSYDYYAATEYSLVVERIVPINITIGDTINTNFDDEAVQFYSFEGHEGDALNIGVDSNGTVDTKITVAAPSGYELAYDDDGGTGFDPEIQSLLLPEDGLYTVTVRAYIWGDNGQFTLSITGGAMPSLESGSHIVRISDKQFEGKATFEGIAGETLQLSVRLLAGIADESRVRVMQNDTVLASNSIGKAERILLEFVVPEDGPVQVIVSSDYYAPAVIELSLERMGE